jgi:hypothetical protein
MLCRRIAELQDGNHLHIAQEILIFQLTGRKEQIILVKHTRHINPLFQKEGKTINCHTTKMLSYSQPLQQQDLNQMQHRAILPRLGQDQMIVVQIKNLQGPAQI